MHTILPTSGDKAPNGAHYEDSSWAGKTWVINHSDAAIQPILPVGCSFRLLAADDAPLTRSYRLEFDGENMTRYWRGLVLRAVPGVPPTMENLTPWANNDEVKADYAEYLRQFGERYLMDLAVERLEGVIKVGDELETVRFYCAAGAQKNGEDWIVIDVIVPARQNGTAHGDPK